ncbi:MAG: type II toxin-antitoxin system RelE/ParE family toxin [Dinghuibacter sp.]|nr:type II toxin-antitoxin system RelE/ParE family toxin [Dinghuibacter sp.]
MGNKTKTTTKKFTVSISLNALRNLDEVTGYVAFIKQQPLNAINIGDAFFELIERIARNPFSFRECEELPTKDRIYRRAVCYSWSVIYRIKDNEVLILGLIHHSRRPSAIRKLKRIK